MPKRRRNVKKFFLFFSFFTLLLVILFFGFQKLFLANLASKLNFDFFKIKRVVCFEEEFPCQSERLSIFEQVYNENIFLFGSLELSKKTKEANPEIEKLEITKLLPGTLRIKIIKRRPAVYLTSNKKEYFLSDANGVIFQGPLTENDFFKNLPLIIFAPESLKLELGLDLKNYESFKKALHLQETLKGFFINFLEIKIENEGDLTLSLNNGITATFSAKKNLKRQVASLQLILKQSKIEEKFIYEIDLRFEKPVIKF